MLLLPLLGLRCPFLRVKYTLDYFIYLVESLLVEALHQCFSRRNGAACRLIGVFEHNLYCFECEQGS